MTPKIEPHQLCEVELPDSWAALSHVITSLVLDDLDAWRRELRRCGSLHVYVFCCALLQRCRPIDTALATVLLERLPSTGDAVDVLRAVILLTTELSDDLASELLKVARTHQEDIVVATIVHTLCERSRMGLREDNAAEGV